MPMQNGVDRTLGGNPDVSRKPPQQELADLASTPVRQGSSPNYGKKPNRLNFMANASTTSQSKL
jgi:hypothetical protein